MGYASLSGRARTSTRNPRAFAVCDRCGIWYNHVNLKWQFDWAGASLINKRILVCDPCYDTPQNQLRAIILPADPTPVINPRIELYAVDETDSVTTALNPTTNQSSGLPVYNPTYLVDENNEQVTTQPIGQPVGLTQGAIMPVQNTLKYAVTLPVISMNANGTTVITVTCSSPTGLTTNSQISVQGTTKGAATDGFYSVTVGQSQTQFTYTVAQNVASGSILGSTTLVKTAIVGVPLDYTQIPQTGPVS
jgi:hypothetical protein